MTCTKCGSSTQTVEAIFAQHEGDFRALRTWRYRIPEPKKCLLVHPYLVYTATALIFWLMFIKFWMLFFISEAAPELMPLYGTILGYSVFVTAAVSFIVIPIYVIGASIYNGTKYRNKLWQWNQSHYCEQCSSIVPVA